ncbi:hypothetical protein D3C85_824120 [compost metagenome]
MKTLRQGLYEKGGKESRALEELAKAYDQMTLGYDFYPDECLDLIFEILTVEELFMRPGMDSFLLRFSTDIERLSASQKSKLLDIIVNNYNKYRSLDFCWVISDIIARQYEPSSAIYAFNRIAKSSTTQGKEGIALGLNILSKHKELDDFLKNNIKDIMNMLSLIQ